MMTTPLSRDASSTSLKYVIFETDTYQNYYFLKFILFNLYIYIYIFMNINK